jgi:predicted transcriptional regulator
MTRLNARIDDELAAKLEHLRERTDMSVTDIVRASISLYYDQFREREAGAAREILDDVGFVGCGEAESDLSSTYKEGLTTSLAGKSTT